MSAYGTSIHALPDLTFRRISGLTNLRQALIFSLMTPRGALFWAPDEGVDLREFVQDTWDDQVRFELEAVVAAQIERDRRVREVAVTATQADQQLVRLRADVVTAQGPFSFVLLISQVSIEVLNADTV